MIIPQRGIQLMIVVETLAFTRRVIALMSDDEYTAMQWFLRFKPDAGDIIRRTGGARKVRWRKISFVFFFAFDHSFPLRTLRLRGEHSFFFFVSFVVKSLSASYLLYYLVSIFHCLCNQIIVFHINFFDFF